MSGTRRTRKRARTSRAPQPEAAAAPVASTAPRGRADWLRLFLPLAAGAVVGIVISAYGLGWIQLVIVVVAFAVIFSSLARIRRAQRR